MEELRLIKIQSSFDRRRRESEVKEYSPVSLLELRNAEVPLDVEFIVSLNGSVVSSEQLSLIIPKPGDCIVFTPKIEGGDVFRSIALIVVAIAATFAAAFTYGAMAPTAGAAWASVYGALAGAAVSLVGGMLVNAVLPASLPEVSDYNRSQTYSWSPVTTQQQGIALPVLYGKNKVYGNIISGYIDSGIGLSTENAKLNMLIDLGIGPIRSITDIKINDQSSGFYSGVELDSRLGRLFQRVIPLFDGEKVTYIPNREIKFDSSEGERTYTTPDNDFDGLEIVLSFPRGLFHSNDQGGIDAHSVEVSVEIRNVTEGESFRSIGSTTTTHEEPAEYYWSLGYWIQDNSTEGGGNGPDGSDDGDSGGVGEGADGGDGSSGGSGSA